MASAAAGVRVAGPDVGRLGELLRPTGRRYAASDDGDGSIVVADRSGEQIGRLIAANAIVVSELAPVVQSLEEVFFELTDGAGGGPS